MKTRPSICCALFAVSLAAATLVSGCTSPGYPTLKQTRMIVDSPMNRYRNAVSAGAVTLAEQQQVNAAYQSYQTAFDAAVKAANSNYDVTTPDNVKALANQVLAAIGAIPF